MSKIGIIDWGIGGVSIYKLIKKNIADTSVVYFSDTGVTPYGKMSHPELVTRLNRVISFLRNDQEVTHLVIGCNAASTALGHIDTRGLKVEGMIESGVEAAIRAKPSRLGLIGGRRTVLSGVYRRAFSDRNVTIKQRIAQPLSGLIERGDLSSATLMREARRILSPLRNYSHILLACTHYRAITPVLRQCVSHHTEFIDPAPLLVQKVGKWTIDGSDDDTFFTSGDASAMRKSARYAFDVDIKKARTITL